MLLGKKMIKIFFDYPHHIPFGAVSMPVEEILSFADRYLEK
jgi:hypothetical protein